MKKRNKYEPKFSFPVVQAKQYAVDNYYLFIDELLTSNSSMGTHYQVITTKHIQLIFNQSQADAQQLSMRHRKEVYLGTCNYHLQSFHPLSNPETDVIQYQDAFNNILITIWSDGLFKALFWKSLVQKIVYHYFGEPNSNNQAILSNNFIPLISTILAHNNSIFQNFLDKLLSSKAYLVYSKITTITTTQDLFFGWLTSASLASELLNILLRYLAIQHNHASILATTYPIE